MVNKENSIQQLNTIGIGQINFIEENSGFDCPMGFTRSLNINIGEQLGKSYQHLLAYIMF